MSTAQRSAAARDVCAQTPTDGWRPVRRGGKFLFEYHPERDLIRVLKNGRWFVVDLRLLKDSERMC